MAFPTLTRRPKQTDVATSENDIRSKKEAGYQQRRARFTRSPRVVSVQYDLLPTVDKEAILTHYATVGTHTAFDYTSTDGVTFRVWYNQPPKYVKTVTGYYQFDTLEFQEV